MRPAPGKIIDRILALLNQLKDVCPDEKKNSLLEELEDRFDDLIIYEGHANTTLGRTVGILEEERKRIAREIHDGPTQVIASIIRRLEYCEALALAAETKKDKLIEELQAIRNDLRREMSGLRTMIYCLRPPALDDLGLRPAVESLVKTLKREKDINVEISGADWPALAKEAELNIYRIIQEALNNIWKHSDTSRVLITLAHDRAMAASLPAGRHGGTTGLAPDPVGLAPGPVGLAPGPAGFQWTIEDFGSKPVSLEVDEELVKKGRSGVIHMRERAELMAAEIVMTPKPEGGLNIVIRYVPPEYGAAPPE